MKSLETKIPPPVVAALIAISMWLCSTAGPSLHLNEILSAAICTLFLMSGISIALMGNLAFKKAKTTVNPVNPEKASSLVSNGIYKTTRNPMYVGLALILVAWAVYLSSIWMFLGIPAFVIYINCFQILPEERALRQLFGTEYERYTSEVRRWL